METSHVQRIVSYTMAKCFSYKPQYKWYMDMEFDHNNTSVGYKIKTFKKRTQWITLWYLWYDSYNHPPPPPILWQRSLLYMPCSEFQGCRFAFSTPYCACSCLDTWPLEVPAHTLPIVKPGIVCCSGKISWKALSPSYLGSRLGLYFMCQGAIYLVLYVCLTRFQANLASARTW